MKCPLTRLEKDCTHDCQWWDAIESLCDIGRLANSLENIEILTQTIMDAIVNSISGGDERGEDEVVQ
jgi:hypothetical protein